jgi:phytoene desaturase
MSSPEIRSKRAAVIGSGFGGLAVAIRLQTAGFETTIFEALDQPGGRATVHRERGYVFDAGPTVITAPHCLEELWSEAGRDMRDDVELLPVAPFYRLQWSDGDKFDYTGDASDMLRVVGQRSPGDVEGYQRFVQYAKQVFEKGYEELAATPFLRFSDMIKVAPQLAMLRADRSVYSTVSRFVKDEHLRQALSFHTLLVGGNPFETSAIYTLIHYLERKWGVFFPRGGTGALVAGMVKLFESLGGKLRLSTPVQRVRVLRNGRTVHRVQTAHGEHDFDLVVSNADLHHTYSRGKRAGSHPSTGPCRCSCCISARIAATASVWPITRCCSDRVTKSCCTTSSTAQTCRTTSVCICMHPRSRILRSRQTAAIASMCCHRCRTWDKPISIGARSHLAMPIAFWRRSSR